MRITTGGILRGYQANLTRSLSNLNTARNHVLTERNFNSAAENPGGAIREAQLLRQFQSNKDSLSMIGDVQKRQLVQEDSLMQVNKILSEISDKYSLEAVNATNGEEERKTFATAIRHLQKSMVLSMNASYENQFVFAGSDGKNPPFELSPDGSTLTYRGINVNTTDPAELDQLRNMMGENQYVDLGFGLTLDNNAQVVSSSAFDIAMPGIKIMGFGTDANGMSENIISLAGQMADELEKGSFDADRYKELMTKFKGKSSEVLKSVTQLGINSQYLDSTENRLKDSDINLQEQLKKVAGIDMPTAITNYSYAQYAYNAALKVGTNILSPSFIDFMK